LRQTEEWRVPATSTAKRSSRKLEWTLAFPSTLLRTRIMLTDVSQWEAAARARGEHFAAVQPATTFVGVQDFINRQWLVEVEADFRCGRRIADGGG
jgi:enamine deaminase RidA (YjgF/YER057c/UK114 family)